MWPNWQAHMHCSLGLLQNPFFPVPNQCWHSFMVCDVWSRAIFTVVKLVVCVCACVCYHSVMSNSLWPHGCSLPGSSVPGISQARILEWVVIPFSGGSSQPKDRIQISCIGRQILYHWATCEGLTGRLGVVKGIFDLGYFPTYDEFIGM